MINFSNCLFVSSVFCLLVCTYSCEKTDTRSNTKEITSISIPNVSSKIHKKNDTIIISVGKEVDVSNLTPIIPIYWHSIGVHNNKMYVLGGMHSGNIHTNEVWWSENGMSWTLQKHNFWLPRHAASVISFKGDLYMIGGTIDPPAAKDTQNDVWVMSGDF